jgi:UDP-N-acetylmuramate--alanine ligase
VTGRLVADGVRRAAPEKQVWYLPTGGEVVGFLVREAREGDLVITMGCGDVWMFGRVAQERLREGP